MSWLAIPAFITPMLVLAVVMGGAMFGDTEVIPPWVAVPLIIVAITYLVFFFRNGEEE